MKSVIVSMIAVAGAASIANAQPYPNDAVMRFQVWDGSSWVSSITATPGSRVEYRATISYTGTRTDVISLGSVLYQPLIENYDNTGATRDDHFGFRNGGVGGTSVPGSLVGRNNDGTINAAEVNGGAPLPAGTGPLQGYGRVLFGATGSNTTNGNVVTAFRHGGDSPVNGAPAGSWLRIAGNSVSNWPVFPLNTTALATVNNINAIKRGVQSSQQANVNAITGLTNTFWVGGTQNIVVFRGAFTLGDSTLTRTITSRIDFLDRDGGANNADDDRFVNWQNGTFDLGAVKTGLTYEAATVIIPSPASLALLGLGGLVAARRRRA
jgi:hypothetical protein